ncbi:MAG: serine/threonine-protein kinase [Sandaracinaceae bacterium]
MDDELYDDDPASLTLSGKTIAGRYKVISLLGQGGSGRVYLAQQIGLDRRVAIKVIRKDRKEDPVTAARFMREAKAAGRIQSPHVVTLFDFGRDGEEDYIAMELLEGQSLAERLKGNEPISTHEALSIASSIAKGLKAAHEAGVLHRDLKPGNVFLCADGTVKVLDFGIAKLLDDESPEWGEPLTQVNRIIGTPVYMSPEAATRRPLGPQTDLYGLGLILFEMVVGEPPFRTGNAMNTLKAQVTDPAPRLGVAAPWISVPASLEDLVDALLQKDPEARPRDAAEVLERLAAVSGRVEVAASASREARTRVDVRRPALEEPEMSTAENTADNTADSEMTEVWSGRPWEGTDLPEPVLPAPLGSPAPAFEAAPPAPAPAPSKSNRAQGLLLLVIASGITGLLAFGLILLLRVLL